MLDLEIQEKNIGYITKDQLMIAGEWRLKRIPPTCEVCLGKEGYKVMKLYTQFIFRSKPVRLIQCMCCGDRTELEHFEYNEIKSIVKLNHKKNLGKINEVDYVDEMEKIL